VGTQPVLDIESLLSPIDAAAPCGGDPRLDPSPVSPYQSLKDARLAAADAERNQERGFGDDGDAKITEEMARKSWNLIASQGPAMIVSTAKDLEVAAWLTEAMLRQHRFAGLRDGLRLLAGLVERYWENVFPLPDEDGLETRLVPIAGLSGYDAEGRLIAPLKRMPLSDADVPIAFWQYESAANGASGDGSGALAAFESGVQHSSPQFIRDLVEDGRGCLAALDELEAALQARADGETPSFSRLRELVAGIVDAVTAYGASALPDDPLIAEQPGAANPDSGLDPAAAPSEVGGVRPLDRVAAIRQLEELARFFRRTEPHSPIAYALDNLVRRGRLTFPELIEELIVDANARRDYFVNAGIRPPSEEVKG
jgi:type VI secretion system protein ImpA